MDKLRIGWASRDVSTDKPINIPGQFHMRISEGILDPVTITALVIDNGQDCVIFLSADLVVIRAGLLDDIRSKVGKQNSAIPVLKIVMNATHTHCGPSHYQDKASGWETGSSTAQVDSVPHDGVEIASSDDYRDFLSTQASEAICEAYEKRTPGGIAFGYGYAVVAHSRRVVYFDDLSKRSQETASGFRVNGKAQMYGNTNDAKFSHYEAGADHFVNLLFTFDSQNKLTGAIVNVPCPSQNSEHRFMQSADYWHDTREAIRKVHGDIFILPQCAAGGDLSPRVLHYKQAQERRFLLKYGNAGQVPDKDLAERKDIAERITACFTEVYSWAKKEICTELPIEHIVKTVKLSRRLISKTEYEFAVQSLTPLLEQDFCQEGTPKERLIRNSQLVAQRARFQRIIKRYETQAAEPRLPTELHVLRIGDIAFASNRFELYMDFMHRIQARSPFLQTFIIQLTGVPGPDGGTYLATTRGAQGKGYSACLFCNLVSPKGGQQLVDQTVKILEQLHEKE
ncbi:MAG: hypothetical protein WCT05_02040 [Lentisphaeria bacterium]